MDINELKKLIKIVENSKITEFSMQEGDLKVKISKNGKIGNGFPSYPHIEMQPHSVPAGLSSVQSSDFEKITEKPEVNVNIHEIKSPIVGTFYRAPAPDADPYVQIGDNVTSGSVLCIVEAMKLMNEIECDISGKIINILVDNATPVEYNQPLFLIEKS